MKKKALIVAALAGFINTFLKHDIELLQQKGYEVHCAANAKNKIKEENEKEFNDLGVIFHQIDFSSQSPFSKQTIIAWKQFKKLLRDDFYEIIHCHTPIPGVIARINASVYRKKGTKVIYTSHGFYFHKGSGKKEWLIYYPIEKIMSTLCDAIITINTEDYNVAKKMFCKKVFHINGVGCNTQKYREVEINRDIKRKSLGIEKNDIMVLDVGELSQRKNHGVVIEALGEVADEKIVLVICGKAIQGMGTYEELRKKAEDLGVNVIFAGHRADIPELCHCAEFGVLASKREGLGLSGIEMLSAGIPLVTSNVHGIKDYMRNDITGYMCNPYDKREFALAIKKLCDSEVRQSMRNACIEMSKNFDNAISFKQMEEIYSIVIDQ